MTARRALANVGLAVAAALLALIAAELLLRAVGYDYEPLRLYVRNPDRRSVHLFLEEHFVYDPDLIWRPRPCAAVFNAQGFRGPELPAAKPAGERRLFTVGDSNTLGWDGEDGANWPADLQRLLDAAGAHVTVVNAGVWGYSSHQGVARLREVLAYRPDWILISFGCNDAGAVGVGDREFLARGAFRRGLERRLLPFTVGRLALGALRVTRRTDGTHRVPPAEYRSNLETMLELARTADARAALMTRPYVGGVYGERSWKHLAPAYRQLTVEVGTATGTPVVDLYSEFRDRDELFADDTHFNEEGHRLAARIVLERLRPLLLAAAE